MDKMMWANPSDKTKEYPHQFTNFIFVILSSTHSPINLACMNTSTHNNYRLWITLCYTIPV